MINLTFRRKLSKILLLIVALLTLKAHSQEKCLIISDLHFNPIYDTVIKQQLLSTDVANWKQTFTASPLSSNNYAKFKSDINYKSLESALDAMKKTFDNKHTRPRFIIITGDMLWHAGPVKPLSDIILLQKQALKFIAAEIRGRFPNTLVLPVLGNNDTDEGDNKIQSAPFLNAFEEAWQTNAPEAFDTSLSQTGYYASAINAGPDILIMNTNLVNPTAPEHAGDNMMTWLEEKLNTANQNGKKVWILMHIPPGMDGNTGRPLWQPVYTQRFLTAIGRYSGAAGNQTIKTMIAGHTHRNDFRIIYKNNVPINIIRVVPSVSPIFYNNPAFIVAGIDSVNKTISNQETWYFDLNNPQNQWNNHQTVEEAIGRGSTDPVQLAENLSRFRTRDQFDRWVDFTTINNRVVHNRHNRYPETFGNSGQYWDADSLVVLGN